MCMSGNLVITLRTRDADLIVTLRTRDADLIVTLRTRDADLIVTLRTRDADLIVTLRTRIARSLSENLFSSVSEVQTMARSHDLTRSNAILGTARYLSTSICLHLPTWGCGGGGRVM